MAHRNASILPENLVSCKWLAAHLGNPALRIVDIRGYVRSEDLGGGRQKASYTGAPDEYLAGHIPGSVFVNWTTDIVDPDSAVKAQIAPPDRFAAAMEARGIGDGVDVVIVDHIGGHLATRLWWALAYYGHGRTAVLDGGFNRWVALGYPVDTEHVTPPPAIFTPRIQPDLRCEADEVLAVIDTAERQLVDGRDAAMYAGETQRGSRGGHIPTALHLSAKDLIGADGLWKSPEDICHLAAAAGIDVQRPVTAYCNGGVTATAVLFGLQRAGMTDIRNYDGSWNEWGERPELPVEGNRDLFRQPS